MKQYLFFILLLFLNTFILAQKHHKRFEDIDVVHYMFEIQLNDSTNRIECNTMVLINLLKPVKSFTLDLVGLDSTNNGMIVESVKAGSYFRNFTHKNNQLIIEIPDNNNERTVNVVECNIKYSGIPADGLIISKNKFGDRTFFGDNWPNRARHWLPTVDHPSDKATLEFIVYAPEHYQVISNGSLLEESNIEGNMKLTHWKENTPISTKLMVIGVARFAVQYNNKFNEVPVSSWVFPQNKTDGFIDYAFGTKSLQYFTKIIGAYSYEKLAHVQSKTRYGGMENASCIFYSERTVNGKNQQERLFAHETAHQWFGNSVTEQNWHHIWLSEGFATYLTHVYNQNFLGEEHFRTGLENDRKRVINYASRKLAPIIDTTVTEYIRLLNTNSYQKASWFLHMLRGKVGDSIFFSGLQKYYHDFQNSTALTKDFLNVMENISEMELDSFFQQWLGQPGHPKLEVDWNQESNKTLKLEITQTQTDYCFSFPLEIEIQFTNGETRFEILEIDDWNFDVTIPVKEKVKLLRLDPNIKLLFEEINK
jgi:aminopeptidase N